MLGTLYGVGLAAAFNAWRFTEDLEPESWRWMFWVNLPLTALAMLVVAPHGARPDRRRDRRHRPGPASMWSAVACSRWRWGCWWSGCTTPIRRAVCCRPGGCR